MVCLNPATLLYMSVSLPLSRAEEQQQRTHDSGPSTRYEKDKQQDHTDFIPPYLYLSGRRHPYVARAACAPNLVMEEEMTQNDEEVRVNKIWWPWRLKLFSALIDCSLVSL